VNRVRLDGHVGADPELRFTPSGAPVLKVRLCTPADDEGPEQWHRVTLWGWRAPLVAAGLKRGDRVLVDGRLHTSSYEKDGERRWVTDVIAHRVLRSLERRSA
jgi:single-strand DNA-binding protein